MRFIRASAFMVATLLCGKSVSAQICAGRPAFSTAHLQLGVAAEGSIDAVMFGGELSGGGDHGFFGRAGVRREGTSSNLVGWVFSGAAGYQLRDDDSGLPRFCPVVSLSRGTFNVADFAHLVRTQFQVGGTFGFSTQPGALSALVPYAGFALARLSYDVEIDGSEGMTLGSDTYVPMTFGVGLHRRAFALVGEITFPVRLLGGDQSFALRGFIPFRFR